MKRNSIFRTITIICLSFITQLSFGQYKVPDKPKFIPPVIDSINLLSKSQYQKLYDKLKSYSDSTSTEIVVAIISNTKNESIGILAPRWGHKWGIGQKKEDNGVFILLAKDDRKIWIAPGYGVEHKLTAGITGELVRNIIIPEFKKGNYYRGLDKGVNAIFKVLEGEYKRKHKKKDSSFSLGPLLFIIILIILILLISRGNRNNRGGRRRRRRDDIARDILDTIILSNAGRGGFGSGGFGGSSGGGFGGFGGGGGFSGGGAGGSW